MLEKSNQELQEGLTDFLKSVSFSGFALSGRNSARTLTTAHRKKDEKKVFEDQLQEILVTIYRKIDQAISLRIDDDESHSQENQANKSTGRMPRHQAPKKDVASCEKHGGAASRHRSHDIRMGKPSWWKTSYS